MVRVRVSDAAWSAWRRYCDLVGVSIGEAIAALVVAELTSVVDGGDCRTLDLVAEMKASLERRLASVDERQRQLEVREERLRRRERVLIDGEREKVSGRILLPGKARVVGRNEVCPCGSALKYKRCHGKPM